MARKLIQRYLPDPNRLKRSRSLRFLGEHLLDPNLWHLNRRSAALAFAVGIFTAFLPIPFQMVVAAFLALIIRCNLPLSVALVWITNPLTMPVIFYLTYRVGCFILQTPLEANSFEMSLDWLKHELYRIWMPLYLGSVVSGIIGAAISYFGIRIFWRWHISSAWKERRRKRQTDKK